MVIFILSMNHCIIIVHASCQAWLDCHRRKILHSYKMKCILTANNDAKDGKRDHEAAATDADGGVDGGLVADVVLGQ